MRICHVSSMHEYNDDRIFQRACVGLARGGNEVSYIVTHRGNENINGVELIALKKRKGLNRRLFTSFEAFRKVFKTKHKIIHFHDPDLIPWMLLLRLGGKKVIYDVHENYASRIYKGRGLTRKIAARVYRAFENFSAGMFSGIIVVTESMRQLFKNVKTPILIIDNFVYLARLQDIDVEAIKKEIPSVIFTSGTNSPARNCLQTIEALPLILKEFPDVKMRFAGRYHPADFKKKLISKAEELSIKDNVEFEEMLPWEENFKRTASALIGCVFYEDNLNNKITLPNRLYEYMFCGAAVIGEDFPEVRKVINDAQCGVMVNSSNPSAIAGAVIKMLRSYEETLQMGKNGREAVLTKYNFDNVLPKLNKFYQDIFAA